MRSLKEAKSTLSNIKTTVLLAMLNIYKSKKNSDESNDLAIKAIEEVLEERRNNYGSN